MRVNYEIQYFQSTIKIFLSISIRTLRVLNERYFRWLFQNHVHFHFVMTRSPTPQLAHPPINSIALQSADSAALLRRLVLLQNVGDLLIQNYSLLGSLPSNRHLLSDDDKLIEPPAELDIGRLRLLLLTSQKVRAPDARA